MGLEVAGTVAALGPGAKKGWKLGDRVMALLCGGGYAEYVAVPEELLMPVPPNLSLCQAAAIPEVWLTAFQLLAFIGTETIKQKQRIPLQLQYPLLQFFFNQPASVLGAICATAQVQPGEVVLAHAGASGVGTAAVQLVRLFGAVPVVTAGSPEKLKMAENLGAAAGFNYREGSFAQRVHDFTGGKSFRHVTVRQSKYLFY